MPLDADIRMRTCAAARLDGDAHEPEFKGRWHLEAGFGHCDVPGTPVFATLDEAGAWVQGQVKRP